MAERTRKGQAGTVVPAQAGRPAAAHVAQACRGPIRAGAVSPFPAPTGVRSPAPHVQAAVGAVQARMAPQPPAPPRHVREALERVVQPRAGTGPAVSPPQPRRVQPPPVPVPRGRSPVVQRMEENPSYSKSSVLKKDTGGGSWTYQSKTSSEKLTIVDCGDQFKAYLDGKYVGYISYEVETEDSVRRMRFGYISITAKKERSKKISSVLIFHLAVKALQSGLQVMCVGHPDPDLRPYWEAMGFDFAAGLRAQWEHNKKLYGIDAAGTLDSVKVVTEASGSVVQILQWARNSLEKQWSG
jgi:hypothetical protein